MDRRRLFPLLAAPPLAVCSLLVAEAAGAGVTGRRVVMIVVGVLLVAFGTPWALLRRRDGVAPEMDEEAPRFPDVPDLKRVHTSPLVAVVNGDDFQRVPPELLDKLERDMLFQFHWARTPVRTDDYFSPDDELALSPVSVFRATSTEQREVIKRLRPMRMKAHIEGLNEPLDHLAGDS